MMCKHKLKASSLGININVINITEVLLYITCDLWFRNGNACMNVKENLRSFR